MAKNVWWIGDSTVQENRFDTWPQCGMGQELYLYLRPAFTVRNHAKNGRSARTFREEGRFIPVAEGLEAGDLLLISFGHNDQKPVINPAAYSAPEVYKARLIAYAREAQEKGAFPVLLSPLERRKFENGVPQATHGPYPDAVREAAGEAGLPFIDLNAKSRALLASLGEAESRRLFMNFDAGLYPHFPNGLADNTHLRYEGAVRFAGLVAEGLRELGSPYADFLLENTGEILKEAPAAVM